MNDKYVCINIIYLLIALCLFFDVLYIIFNAKKKNIIGLIVKTLAALCFIAIGYFAYQSNNTAFSKLILYGLILDGIGDLLLALRNIFAKNFTFFIGGLLFLTGHIVYIRALTLLTNPYFLECIISAILVGAFLFYIIDKVCRLNRAFTILGIAYVMIITMMVSLAIGVYVSNPIDSNLVFMLGAILFLCSDIILIIYNFSKKDKWMHPVYSVLYFIAQILISFSLHI